MTKLKQMKYTGITRPVDELGRVVVPKEIRESMDIRDKDRMEIWVSDDGIMLRKICRRCSMCGAENVDRIEVGRMQFCWECAGKIAERVLSP